MRKLGDKVMIVRGKGKYSWIDIEPGSYEGIVTKISNKKTDEITVWTDKEKGYFFCVRLPKESLNKRIP